MSVDDGVIVHGLHVYVYVLYMRFDLTWLDSITVGGNENEYKYSTKKYTHKHTQKNIEYCTTTTKSDPRRMQFIPYYTVLQIFCFSIIFHYQWMREKQRE